MHTLTRNLYVKDYHTKSASTIIYGNFSLQLVKYIDQLEGKSGIPTQTSLSMIQKHD